MSKINHVAIFSDETENFVSKPEPLPGDIITISIRTKKDDVDSVFFRISGMGLGMSKTKSDAIFDYYCVDIIVNERIEYYFSLKKGSKMYYYSKRGLSDKINFEYLFTIIPGFTTPKWAKSAVMYQIFVDRFYNGDKTNDVKNLEYLYLGNLVRKIDNWDATLQENDYCHFFGGDLQGVIDKMEYLKNLGIEVIYFNPLFVSPSNHKYDIQDYDYIDPHYGTIVNDGGSLLSFDFLDNKYASMYIKRTTDKQNLEASNKIMIKLIEIAHKNDIKVILDGVFNHSGAFHKWLDKDGFYKHQVKGAYEHKNSDYKDYFIWHKHDWPNNNSYDGWWGHDNHPKLNFEASQELYDYMMYIAAKWVSPPFNADGWRLDVAADLGQSREFNHKFWKDFRTAVKNANSDAIILAEHYGNPRDWLDGKQWDSVMNYDAFMEPLGWFFTGMQKHSQEFREDMMSNAGVFESSMKHFMSKIPYPAAMTAMNQISNHDHSRFLTRTNMKVGRLHTVGAKQADTGINKSIFMAAVAVQFTWLGCPTIYYGDEAGLCGWTDPDNRRPYPWGREDLELISYHRAIIALHKQHSSLKTGSLDFLHLGHGTMAYCRFDKYESIICIFNNNDALKELEIPVWQANIPLDASLQEIMATYNQSFEITLEQYKLSKGILSINLPAFSSAILHYKQN